MKKRVMSWLAVACLSAYTSSAYALELGEMRVLSALGEPLKIQLTLTDLGEFSATDARVIMAPAEDYSRLGLIPPVGADQWQVVMQNEGKLSALISGVMPQQEANVSFLVQLRWPGYIRVRQVTAVLLPETPAIAETPASVEAPLLAETLPAQNLTSAGTATLTVDSQANATPELVPAAPEAKPFTEAVERIEVAPLTKRTQAGDTLSSLANDWPLPQASQVQKQQVLAESNPRIFINDNINLLKRGAVVTYPLSSDVTLPEPSQAQQWLAARLAAAAGQEAVPVDQPALASESSAAASAGNEEVSLTLISPKAASNDQSAQAEALIADELAQLASKKSSLLAERAALQAELAKLEGTGKDQDARLKVLDEKLALLNAEKPQPNTKDAQQDSPAVDSIRLSWVAAAVGFLVALLIVLRRRAAAASNAALAARAAPIVPVAHDYVAFEPLETLPTPPWTASHQAPVAEDDHQAFSELAVEADAALDEEEAEVEEEYDFMTDAESAALQTRLDLAQAYIDMQEMDLAKELLNTVITRGSEEQRTQAQQILDKLS